MPPAKISMLLTPTPAKKSLYNNNNNKKKEMAPNVEKHKAKQALLSINVLYSIK